MTTDQLTDEALLADEDLTAAEFALGTLTPDERLALRQAFARKPATARSAATWSLRLQPLLALVPEREPPEHIWDGLNASLDLLSAPEEPSHAAAPAVVPQTASAPATPEPAPHETAPAEPASLEDRQPPATTDPSALPVETSTATLSKTSPAVELVTPTPPLVTEDAPSDLSSSPAQALAYEQSHKLEQSPAEIYDQVLSPRQGPLDDAAEIVAPASPMALKTAPHEQSQDIATLETKIWGLRRQLARRSLALWSVRFAAFFSSAVAALLLGFVLFDGSGFLFGKQTPPRHIAVLDTNEQTPNLLVWLDIAQSTILVRPINVEEAGPSQSLEAWIIEGPDHRSLGLIDATRDTLLPLSTTSIAKTAMVAISVEPRGGSTLGKPSGPIVYSGKVFSE